MMITLSRFLQPAVLSTLLAISATGRVQAQDGTVPGISQAAAEKSVVLYFLTNDYRTGTDKEYEEFLSIAIDCSGVRVSNNWFLTTAACANELSDYFANSLPYLDALHALDTNILFKAFQPGRVEGIGYITPSSNIVYGTDNKNGFAMVGLESSQFGMGNLATTGVTTNQIDQFNQGLSSLALINFGLKGASTSCGYTVWSADPRLITFKKDTRVSGLVNGEPIFINNGGSFQFFGVYDGTCKIPSSPDIS